MSFPAPPSIVSAPDPLTNVSLNADPVMFCVWIDADAVPPIDTAPVARFADTPALALAYDCDPLSTTFDVRLLGAAPRMSTLDPLPYVTVVPSITCPTPKAPVIVPA